MHATERVGLRLQLSVWLNKKRNQATIRETRLFVFFFYFFYLLTSKKNTKDQLQCCDLI